MTVVVTKIEIDTEKYYKAIYKELYMSNMSDSEKITYTEINEN